MYGNGEGVPEDDVEAVRWYRLAAEQGHASAELNLGLSYEYGTGVPQDYVQAYMWYDISAARMTGEERDNTVKLRDRIEGQMTPSQISDAQRLAREWETKYLQEPPSLHPELF